MVTGDEHLCLGLEPTVNTVVLGEAANRVPKGVMVLTRKGVSAGRSRAAGCELCSVIVASKMRKTVQGTAVRVCHFCAS